MDADPLLNWRISVSQVDHQLPNEVGIYSMDRQQNLGELFFFLLCDICAASPASDLCSRQQAEPEGD